MLDFKKKIALLIVVLLFLGIVLGLGFYLQQKQQKNTAYKRLLGEQEALLIINNGREGERWFKGKVVEGMSVKDALNASAVAGGFDLGPAEQWHCYLNDKEVQDDLDKKMISPKDKIWCQKR